MHRSSFFHATRKTAAAPVIILVLIAAVVVVYYQVRGHEFIAYEDASGLVGFTRGEQVPGIFQAERPSIDTAPRRPVAEYVHALGVRLLGMQAGAHHLANVIFHTINSLLLYIFFLKATDESGKSGFVAAVFALHPLQVESVAWLAQRSVLLGTSFFLLAAVGYLWYAKQPRLTRYLIVCMCFVLGWLTDPVVGVLPLVLLLMDYWPLARFPRFQDGFRSKRPFKEGTLLLIVEKVPLTVVSVFLWAAWAVARKQTMEGVAVYEGIVRGLSNAAGYLFLFLHHFPGCKCGTGLTMSAFFRMRSP